MNFLIYLLVCLPLTITISLSVPSSAMTSHSHTHRDIYVPPDISAMTCDARDWYLKGVSNSEKDLDVFGKIADGLKSGADVEPLVKLQLKELLSQASEANENTIILVPKLQGLITNLFAWTRDPSWFDKAKIKAAIWYVNGKRDNKSYYLQNGAALWCKTRVDKFLAQIETKPAQELRNDLNRFEDELLTARDALDDSAQEYVKGISALVTLVSDISGNLAQIQEVVGRLNDGMESSSDDILKTSQDSVDSIKKKISSLI